MEKLSENQQVTNMSGTSNLTPNNDSTWKQMWERKTDNKFGVCSASSCNSRATDGAHVNVQGIYNMIFFLEFSLVGPCVCHFEHHF